MHAGQEKGQEEGVGMASQSNGGFHVSDSTAVEQRLLRLRAIAKRRGQARAFLTALRKIVRRLATKPRSAGEPLYHLPYLQAEVRTIIVAPVMMSFAVSDTMPIVYLKSIRLLSAPKT